MTFLCKINLCILCTNNKFFLTAKNAQYLCFFFSKSAAFFHCFYILYFFFFFSQTPYIYAFWTQLASSNPLDSAFSVQAAQILQTKLEKLTLETIFG